MNIKNWIKENFTLDAFKASAPLWKKMINDKFNWMIILAVILITYGGWKYWCSDAGIMSLGYGIWIVFHRLFIAAKQIEIDELRNN